MARIANADVAMAATLIRNANGALVPARRRWSPAGRAMNRLGLQPSAALMSTFLARHAIPSRARSSPASGSNRPACAGARLGRHLAARLSPELAHSYGLFCRVRMPVLMQSVRGYAGTMMEGARAATAASSRPRTPATAPTTPWWAR